MQKTINSTMFRKMIIASAKILDDNKAFVDSLNVFPVPDGDTGTNMSLTYNNVVKEHICKIRMKLREITGHEYIETIWGVGYRFKV